MIKPPALALLMALGTPSAGHDRVAVRETGELGRPGALLKIETLGRAAQDAGAGEPSGIEKHGGLPADITSGPRPVRWRG
jgi:hypothetical protein